MAKKSSSSSNEPDYTVQIENFKDDVKSKAENLVLKTFPQKTLELHSLLESPLFNLKNLEKIKHEINIPIPEYPYVTPVQAAAVTVKNDADNVIDDNPEMLNGPSTKKRKYLMLTESTTSTDKDSTTISNDGSRVLVLPYGSVRCNKHIVELIEIVKPLIRQLVDDTNLLKMWVLFLIPRIEDGNNFGVSIQEETLTEIRTVEAEASVYFEQMSRYFLSRAKIITKIAKYPHVDDFRRNVSEIDEKEFISLRLIVAELRNHYASLHDIVVKNLEKIKKPRSQNNTSMF